MSKNCRRKCIKFTVYFVCFSNFVGGTCSVITRGIVPLGGLFLSLGLIAIAGGFLLLVGIVKKCAGFVLIYLILAIMVLTFATVLISVLIIPKVIELRGHIFIVVYSVLFMWWPILYCVYLFYKDLIRNDVSENEIAERAEAVTPPTDSLC